MRFNDFTFAFPALLSAVMITAILGPGAVNSIIAIGIFAIPVFARLTRGAALPLWERDFVLAARVAGQGRTRLPLASTEARRVGNGWVSTCRSRGVPAH